MSNIVRPGNTARGWNDPPEFLHSNDSDVNTSKKTNILNKRVSHALDGKVSQTEDADKSKTLSEPPKLPPPPLYPELLSSEASQKNNEPKESITQNETNLTIEQIEAILNSKIELCKQNNLSSKVCDDILKRIKIFVTNWSKLNDNIKNKMVTLAKELDNCQIKQANEIHVKLMLDYPSEVSQWMVGIKRLIHELISIDENNKKKSEES